jgi:hypothetical protein
MKKIFIVLAFVAVLFTACDGLQPVSYYPKHYYTPVPTVHYMYPRPQYYYYYPQPHYIQPHYNMPHHGGVHR